MTKKTILIASKSLVARTRLKKLLLKESDFSVDGDCVDLKTLQRQVERLDPDIVLISQSLTQVHDFSLIRAFFETQDVRWLSVVDPGLAVSSDFQKTKSDLFASDLNATIKGLPDQIRAVCRADRRRAPLPCDPPHVSRGSEQKLVVIGSSTGGIDALIKILSEYPVDCPPTAIVQHTGFGFGDSLVRLLNQRSAAHIVHAHEGLQLKPGIVGVAAGDGLHLRLKRDRFFVCHLKDGLTVSGHKPSVDELFTSVLPHSQNIIAVLLTGMGKDGSAGIAKLRQANGITIGQDEETSVVYGMPRVAKELDGLTHVLPIEKIGQAILKYSLQSTISAASPR